MLPCHYSWIQQGNFSEYYLIESIVFSSQVLLLWKLKICRGIFLVLETEEGIAVAMTKPCHSLNRIISYSSKLNPKSRDGTLSRQFSVKSLDCLTNKDLHRSQNFKGFIRQRFYWLQGPKKQFNIANVFLEIQCSLILECSLANVLVRHSGITICISLSLQYSFCSISAEKKPQNISNDKCNYNIFCLWNQAFHWL